MRVVKGKCHIAVEQIDGFGKYPGLWIGRNNITVKVASFKNFEAAEAFCKWLRYMIDVEAEEKEIIDWFLKETGKEET